MEGMDRAGNMNLYRLFTPLCTLLCGFEKATKRADLIRTNAIEILLDNDSKDSLFMYMYMYVYIIVINYMRIMYTLIWWVIV